MPAVQPRQWGERWRTSSGTEAWMDLSKMNRYAKLGFDDFRALASDPSLTKYEKIGAHEAYRQGREEDIFRDVLAKLPRLGENGIRVADIGPGCSDLPRMLIEWSGARDHDLLLVDSQEMLSLLPDGPRIRKTAARFPVCEDFLRDNAGAVDVVLIYAVIHHVFLEANIFDFVDRALSLLAPGGMMLIGDIPNVSKRKRFFSSAAGIRFHQAFMNTEEPPQVEFNRLEPANIDDAIMLGLIARARAQGFDAYVLPQPPELPMANRREDLLLVRP
jgi:hypothetical protein